MVQHLPLEGIDVPASQPDADPRRPGRPKRRRLAYSQPTRSLRAVPAAVAADRAEGLFQDSETPTTARP